MSLENDLDLKQRQQQHREAVIVSQRTERWRMGCQSIFAGYLAGARCLDDVKVAIGSHQTTDPTARTAAPRRPTNAHVGAEGEAEAVSVVATTKGSILDFWSTDHARLLRPTLRSLLSKDDASPDDFSSARQVLVREKERININTKRAVDAEVRAADEARLHAINVKDQQKEKGPREEQQEALLQSVLFDVLSGSDNILCKLAVASGSLDLDDRTTKRSVLTKEGRRAFGV
ncbi:hypothetical protein I317_05924 [Kwoniella heveanensis CBS 569]|nr:hypothetical protein I317_05924 [Kwoniella heveanensis CBS 569]